MATYILLLDVITNEKTLKLKQIGRLPALPRFPLQKHIPTTLVGIPVDIYSLTHSIEGCTKLELNDIRLHPGIQGLLKVMRYGKQCISAAQTFQMSKLSSRQKTAFLAIIGELVRN